MRRVHWIVSVSGVQAVEAQGEEQGNGQMD